MCALASASGLAPLAGGIYWSAALTYLCTRIGFRVVHPSLPTDEQTLQADAGGRRLPARAC
jgi:hypothetical protein